MAILLIAIFVGAGLLVVLAGMALLAVAALLVAALRLCVVRPVRCRYRQHQQRAAVRAEVACLHRRARASLGRLEAAAAQAQTEMGRLARGR
ncbi:hypothetical protein TN91_23660 [Rhodococcus ruber]|nr:hypothetical protein TN91_23660 [Rhodococcus ruber]